MKFERSKYGAAVTLAATVALVAACAPRVDTSAVGTGPIPGATKPAPTSPLPPTRPGFAGGPGVGADLNSGIGPGPAFNNPFVR